MKTIPAFVLAVTIAIAAATDSQAMRWYSPSTGKWLSRDPIGEHGGLNIYAFVRNNPLTYIDRLGLKGYNLTILPPTGWWLVSIKDVDFQGVTFKGFHSRYLPTDGRFGHPVCPCKKENIVLVQIVADATFHPTQFDVGGYDPGILPAHASSAPVPAYYVSTPADPLTIIDRPQTKASVGTWEFEDCAICRTHPDSNSTDDQVLGCVRFRFHRIKDDEAELFGTAAHGSGGQIIAEEAKAPTKLWTEALRDWQRRGK